MAFGVDYSQVVTSPAVLRGLRSKGVTFACRYLSTEGNAKNLTASERTALRDAGIAIVTVFETTEMRALRGSAAGADDARLARAELAVLGMSDAVVYFAVDFDAQPGDLAVVASYIGGAAAVLGHDRVGIYGGLRAVGHVLDLGLCRYAWQTYAWSHDAWDARAHLRQERNNQVLAGVRVDFNSSMKPDFGQWPRPPAPAPAGFNPPWLVTVGGSTIARGRLVNPLVVVRIARALYRAGKRPPWRAATAAGVFATGRLWPPGDFTRQVAARLRRGVPVTLSDTVLVRPRPPGT